MATQQRNIKETPLVAYCRAHSVEAAMVMVDIMLDSKEKGSTRIMAAKAIHDRAHGTPVQSLQFSVETPKPIDLSSLTFEELQVYHQLTSKLRPPDEVVDPEDMPDERTMKNVTSIVPINREV